MHIARSRNSWLVPVVAIAGLLLLGVGGVVRAQPCTPSSRPESEAVRVPSFLDAWIAKYPTSTLPARMETQTGRDCNVCHHPPNLNTQGNCYREDLAELLLLGMPIEDAINQLDSVDSDGDGFTNGEEAVADRPESGEVGYNPGLIGDTGTDPCGTNPASAVTGVSETPPPLPVPAMSTWGMVVTALLLTTAGSVVVRRKSLLCHAE